MKLRTKLALAGAGIAAASTAAVVVARTLAFKPEPKPARTPERVDFNFNDAVESLQQLIRCRTVSYEDGSLEDDAEFEKLIGLLPQLYPNVFATCDYSRLSPRALLFRWPGAEEGGNPSVLMAHFDVVPVVEEAWTHDPFGAEIADGAMWGRGTLDTKVTFNGILFAANTLIGQGFTPAHDVYFAFSGGEEVNGPGAPLIVQWFKDHGVDPVMVLDEGGAVVNDVFPGVTQPCGLIGIAEKGIANFSYTAASAGGHASGPKPGSPLPRLAEAVDAIETHPAPMHIAEPAAKMFDTLGRHSSFVYRMIFANLWLFGPAIDLLTRKTGGELNALVRTTVAFTQASGSDAANVIPPSAQVVSNVRINPEDSVAGVVEYLNKTIDDEKVKVDTLYAFEPSPVSRTDCEGWERVVRAVEDTWPGCIVSPYLMVACSDARHYRDLSDKVYRFSACDMTAEERATIHGNDERIRLETLERAVSFFMRVLKQC